VIASCRARADTNPFQSVCAFYGVCAEPNSPLCVVTEWIQGGNLLERISDRGQVLHGRDAVQLARDLASGLQHIHSFLLVHCDIAARNCLVTSAPGVHPLRLRICDFGLSCNLDARGTANSHDRQMAIRWAPPESWSGEMILSREFDTVSPPSILHFRSLC
jgi:serine/threonine protein kinase